ncbi:UBA-like superfamily [Sesbania bispinosa]|nr:UBA-like superfamily [Sesbania bispinosa]
MSGGGGSRVPIPNNVRKIIQDIREITGKQHTDDEIYAVLRECSMDPNETAQKLLYLDTFHEVRRRRDRKKEGLSSRASEESRLKHGGQGRGGRGSSGGYCSNFPDGGGGRNLSIRRENGVNHIAERNHVPSTQPDLQKKANTASQAARGSAVALAPHGAENQSNGKSGHGSTGQSLIVTSSDQRKSLSSSDQLQNSVSGVYSSSSDPVLAPSISRSPVASGAISREVGSNRISAGPNHVKGNKHLEAGDLSASKNEKSGLMNSTSNLNAPQKSNEVENNQLSEPSQYSSSSSLNGSLRPSSSCGSQPAPANVTEVSTSEACVQSSAELRQHVTFPNHFQVPEALKSGLTFGSFDTFGPSERSSSGTGCDNNTSPASLGNDEATTSSNQSASLSAQGDHLDYTHSASYLINKTPASESNSITGTDSKIDQPKQEVLLAPEGHPILTVQNAQNYGLNFMSTMLGTQQVQFEGTEPQTQETSRFPNFVTGANAGNTAHIGIPSGSFITPPPVGYAPGPTVNTGSSTGNEDLAVSQLKENQIYTTGQVSEGSAVWIHAPGQDISSLQVNSLYNLTPQGQHLTFPPTQAAHGAFADIYQPGQAVASPSTLLQQSQAVVGPVEPVGPPSGSYQQPQPAQINWNSNF